MEGGGGGPSGGIFRSELQHMTNIITPAKRHLRQRFQALGLTEDRPCTRRQGRYIRNTHLCNRFQTATASAAYIPGTHNNRISAQSVRNP
jgi:hypothetical protein